MILPPRRRRPIGRACAIALALLTVAACTGGSRAAPSAGPSPVTSNYERASGNTIPRDCGYSSPLPGRAGWSAAGRQGSQPYLGARAQAQSPVT